MSTLFLTREPEGPSKARWVDMIPESRNAMPTPLPSTAGSAAVPAPRTLPAPVAFSSRLWVRAVMRFGEMVSTSLRRAMSSTRAAGSTAETPVTEI